MKHLACVLIATSLLFVGVISEKHTCECKLGFKTYYIQTFRISQIQPMTEDTTCKLFIDACTKYCNEKGTALLTCGAKTELSLGGRVQRLGDYLCQIGRNSSPLNPTGTDLSMFISIWSCEIPRRLTKQMDTNFCCKYQKYRSCE